MTISRLTKKISVKPHDFRLLNTSEGGEKMSKNIDYTTVAYANIEVLTDTYKMLNDELSHYDYDNSQKNTERRNLYKCLHTCFMALIKAEAENISDADTEFILKKLNSDCGNDIKSDS